MPFGKGLDTATVYKESMRPLHPPEQKDRWSKPQPCKFYVNSKYRTDERWERLGDIAVLGFLDWKPSTKEARAYLVPSGRVERPFRYPHLLEADPLALQIKQKIGEEFMKRNGGKMLKGFVFLSEKGWPMVYCPAYDKALQSRIREYLRG